MTVNQRITIDPEVLARCAARLAAVSEGLSGAHRTAASARLGANAFGLINSWMVAPITSVATRSGELIGLSGDVIGAVGVATDAAAGDFADLEETVIAALESIDLGGSP